MTDRVDRTHSTVPASLFFSIWDTAKNLLNMSDGALSVTIGFGATTVYGWRNNDDVRLMHFNALIGGMLELGYVRFGDGWVQSGIEKALVNGAAPPLLSRETTIRVARTLLDSGDIDDAKALLSTL